MASLRGPLRLLGMLWACLLAACATGPEPAAPVEGPAAATSEGSAAAPAQTTPPGEPALDAELSLGQPGEPESREVPSLLEPEPEEETAEVYSGGPPAASAPTDTGKLPLPQAAAAGPRPAPAPKKAPAAKPPAPAPAPAPEKRRELLARKGDSVAIDLEGKGWLYLGLPEKSRGVSLVGSESDERRTTFTFKALEFGEYDLPFQLQDNAQGTSRSETVRLRVLAEEQFRAELARTAETAPASADPARLREAEELFSVGAYEQALPEYLGLYREGDPLLNDRLAAIYVAQKEPAAAAKYFEKNLSAPAPYGERAVLGLVRTGLELGDRQQVLDHVPALLGTRSGGAELLAVARFLAPPAGPKAGSSRAALPPIPAADYSAALDLLSEYLRRYPQDPGLVQALFQLAQLYEQESPLRDFRKARAYYQKVYDDFPESEQAVEARKRILYLDRHFFNVQ